MKFHPIATITAMLLALPFSAFGQANCVPDPENDIFLWRSKCARAIDDGAVCGRYWRSTVYCPPQETLINKTKKAFNNINPAT